MNQASHKRQIFYDSTYMKYQNSQIHRKRKNSFVSAWWQWEMGSYCSSGRVSVLQDEKLKLFRDLLHNVSIVNTTKLYI